MKPQAPIIIQSSKSSFVDSPSYYYPKTFKNITLTLKHTYSGNHLVLQTLNGTNSPLAILSANYITMLELFYADFYCYEIYFKFPGEHKLDDSSYDMELQVHCKDSKKQLYIVAVPVNKVQEGESQSIFFDSLTSVISDAIDQTKLPYNVTITHFGDFLDGFSILDGVYVYETYLNFPPCDVAAYMSFNPRPLKINTALFEQLQSCVDSSKTDGKTNNRTPFEMTSWVDLYQYHLV